jgi:alpha-ribazole phosphatase
LVRHGETTGNSSERFWGSTDVALSETGIRQAERLRDRLALEPIDVVYASSLNRALRTAEIITTGRGPEVIPCPELREIDFGLIEGLNFTEITRDYPELAAAWFTSELALSFPGGESITDLNDRVTGFISRLEAHGQEENVLIVAHSGVLRLLLCNLMDLPLRHWRQLRLGLASLSVLDTYPEIAILSLLNDLSHLA